MNRSAGILMPISSLPSPYGIGTLGKEARKFVDFLNHAGQSYWQILPIGPTGYGDSPYQSISSFAGNPYFIDFDELKKEKLLKASEYQNEYWGDDEEKIDYGVLYQNRFNVLRKASDRLNQNLPEDYNDFLNGNQEWLEDYALFMALKTKYEGKAWSTWPTEVKNHDEASLNALKEELNDEMQFWKNVQYLFFHQWFALKTYANERGVSFIGDLPIYVSPDSPDIWGNQRLFQLDGEGNPTDVAGCPPDAFSADGQLWGNPLYDWELMRNDGYAWWTNRIAHQLAIVDVLRIDHFRGFESYYAIPAKDDTARNGEWRKGPGIDFFRTIESKLGKMNIIAEDLGFLTDDVLQMVKETGYPGMKILQFAFDSRDGKSEYLPHNYPKNCVVYPGTHDNETIMGWFKNAPKHVVKNIKDYMHLDKEEGYQWGIMRSAYVSVADLVVVQFQDVLGLDNRARINTPSTTGINWTWRTKEGTYNNIMARKLRSWMELYGRL